MVITKTRGTKPRKPGDFVILEAQAVFERCAAEAMRSRTGIRLCERFGQLFIVAKDNIDTRARATWQLA